MFPATKTQERWSKETMPWGAFLYFVFLDFPNFVFLNFSNFVFSNFLKFCIFICAPASISSFKVASQWEREWYFFVKPCLIKLRLLTFLPFHHLESHYEYIHIGIPYDENDVYIQGVDNIQWIHNFEVIIISSQISLETSFRWRTLNLASAIFIELVPIKDGKYF